MPVATLLTGWRPCPTRTEDGPNNPTPGSPGLYRPCLKPRQRVVITGEARTAPRARAVRSAGVYRAPFRSKLKVNLSAVKSLRSASLQNVIEVKALSFAYCVEKPAKSHSTRTFQILESDSRPHPYGARIFRKICKILQTSFCFIGALESSQSARILGSHWRPDIRQVLLKLHNSGCLFMLSRGEGRQMERHARALDIEF